MKIKNLLIAICSATVLFTSCEKAEMDSIETDPITTMGKGLTGGGGMDPYENNSVAPNTNTMGKGLTGGGGMQPFSFKTNSTLSTNSTSDSSINLLRSVDVNNSLLSVVTVVIKDTKEAVVYTKKVNVQKTSSLYITRDQFPTGSYLITISTEAGEVLEYDNFTIK